MGIFGFDKQMRSGFTVVEILAVVAVIGILAGITLAVYPSYQKRSLDSERKSDLEQIATALKAYAIQKNNYMQTGSLCGLNGNGNGWVSAGPSEIASYPKSIATCLQDAGLITQGSFIDPSGCKYNGTGCTTPTKAYMKATCTKSGTTITYLFAYLEQQPQNAAVVDAVCDAGTVSGFDTNTQKFGTNHGMNYYIVVR